MTSYMPGPLTMKSNHNGRYYATNTEVTVNQCLALVS